MDVYADETKFQGIIYILAPPRNLQKCDFSLILLSARDVYEITLIIDHLH